MRLAKENATKNNYIKIQTRAQYSPYKYSRRIFTDIFKQILNDQQHSYLSRIGKRINQTEA